MNSGTDKNGGLNIAIIGATGGIGRALVTHYLEHDNLKTLYAIARKTECFEDPRVKSIPIDFQVETSVQDAAKQIDKPLDIVIVASGLLHGNNIQPEKSLRDISSDQMHDVFAINTFGPALVLRHFSPLLRRDRKTVFACLSARVGSISDNHLGGWYSYRASKAALNMLIKTASIEIGRRWPLACVIGLHPGTVDSDLSKPFQGNVPEKQLFSPEKSAQCLINVMDGLDESHTGRIFAWDGQEIAP